MVDVVGREVDVELLVLVLVELLVELVVAPVVVVVLVVVGTGKSAEPNAAKYVGSERITRACEAPRHPPSAGDELHGCVPVSSSRSVNPVGIAV